MRNVRSLRSIKMVVDGSPYLHPYPLYSETFWFHPREFFCPCCSVNEFFEVGIHPALLHLLNRVRFVVGAPVVVTSGLRCPTRNQAVGGAARSRHMYGFAADIVCREKMACFSEAIDEAHEMIRVQFGVRCVELFRVLRYERHVHVHVLDKYWRPCFNAWKSLREGQERHHENLSCSPSVSAFEEA